MPLCQANAPRWQLVHMGSTWRWFGMPSGASPDSRNHWAPASQRHCLRGAARGPELVRVWRSLLYPAVSGSDRVERPALYRIFGVVGLLLLVRSDQHVFGSGCTKSQWREVKTQILPCSPRLSSLNRPRRKGDHDEACRVAVLPYAEFMWCAADHKPKCQPLGPASTSTCNSTAFRFNPLLALVFFALWRLTCSRMAQLLDMFVFALKGPLRCHAGCHCAAHSWRQ